jgi:hypothetical protein
MHVQDEKTKLLSPSREEQITAHTSLMKRVIDEAIEIRTQALFEVTGVSKEQALKHHILRPWLLIATAEYETRGMLSSRAISSLAQIVEQMRTSDALDVTY